MRIFVCLCCALFILSGPAHALKKNDIRNIIKQQYPGARITEVERETYRGRDIWEVDFRHQGKKLEAIIDLQGEIIKTQDDD
jgi:uncharacterized membrane protein YkoI